MKRFGMLVAALSLLSVPAFAQGPRDLSGQADTLERTQQQLQQSIANLYLSDFKNEVGLSDDQFLKVGPILRQFIQMRFRAANQRKVLNERQDQLLSDPNPSPADIQKLNEDLNKLESEAGNMDVRFIRRLQTELVDQTTLSDRQILAVRAFNRKFFNEKLPTLLERLRNASATPKAQRPDAGRANQNPNRGKDPARPANTLRGKNNQLVR